MKLGVSGLLLAAAACARASEAPPPTARPVTPPANGPVTAAPAEPSPTADRLAAPPPPSPPLPPKVALTEAEESWILGALAHCGDWLGLQRHCMTPPTRLRGAYTRVVVGPCFDACRITPARVEQCAARVADGKRARCGALTKEDEHACVVACEARAHALLKQQLNPKPPGGWIAR